jgi:hypothetical protein
LPGGTFSHATSPDVAQRGALAGALDVAGDEAAASATAGVIAAAQATAVAPISRRGR